MPADRPTVAILGAGALGETLTRGLLRAGWLPEDITLAARRENRAEEARNRLGCRCLLDPQEAAKDKDLVMVSVKPKDVNHLLGQLQPKKSQLVVTVAAGIPIATVTTS